MTTPFDYLTRVPVMPAEYFHHRATRNLGRNKPKQQPRDYKLKEGYQLEDKVKKRRGRKGTNPKLLAIRHPPVETPSASNLPGMLEKAWQVLRAQNMDPEERGKEMHKLMAYFRQVPEHIPNAGYVQEEYPKVMRALRKGLKGAPPSSFDIDVPEEKSNLPSAEDLSHEKQHHLEAYDYEPEATLPGIDNTTARTRPRTINYTKDSVPRLEEPPINVDINVNSAHSAQTPPITPQIAQAPRRSFSERSALPYAGPQAPNRFGDHVKVKLVKVKPRRVKRIPKQRIRDTALANRVRF